MFGRKYVFESRNTRTRRLLIGGVSVSAIIVILLATFIVYIPIYARLQKASAADGLYQKSPDAIVVFTGDKGRIAYAMDLLKTNPTAKLLISGVYEKNSVKTLLNKQVDPHTSEEVVDENMQVDLDYESRNTFENVRETVQFLKQNPNINKVLVISSDYHIMRIKFIFTHFIDDPKKEFFFDSVPNDYTSWRETRKLLKETVKIARTFFILKILGEDVVGED